MLGFLNLNKPLGLTSHDVVAKARRLLREKRIGHAGTLDPAAQGVLPIALGKATRLLQFLPESKAYEALIRLGIQTTTDDLEGEVLAAHSASQLSLSEIELELSHFLGKIEQVPPNYSAIQIHGKRLYDLARKGEIIEVPARIVEVYQLDILGWQIQELEEIAVGENVINGLTVGALKVAIACGSGTYIRSMARDLGTRLKVGGTLASLLRTESSGFSLATSITLEELEHQIQQQNLSLISPDIALKHLDSITLPPPEAKRWCQGQKILIESHALSHLQQPIRVYTSEQTLLGIGKLTMGENQPILIPSVVLETEIKLS